MYRPTFLIAVSLSLLSRPAVADLDLLGDPAAAEVVHEQPDPRPPDRTDLYLGLQIAFTGLYVSLAATRSVPSRPLSGEVLPLELVNDMDRSVVGNHSSTAAAASDALLATGLGLPFVLSAFDHLLAGGEGAAGLGEDSLILLETFAVSSILCNVVKVAVRRPRPLMYDVSSDPAAREANDATLSFFSGHTALAFSMATAYSYLFTARHGDSALVWPVWLGTHGIALATALMRVEAGKHFWSDVAVGALVGSGVGLLVPYLHRNTAWDSLFKRGALADLRVMPISYPGGGWGVNVMAFW